MGKIDWFMPFHSCYVKYKQLRLEFELGSPIPFRKKITVMLSSPLRHSVFLLFLCKSGNNKEFAYHRYYIMTSPTKCSHQWNIQNKPQWGFVTTCLSMSFIIGIRWRPRSSSSLFLSQLFKIQTFWENQQWCISFCLRKQITQTNV